MSAHDQHIDFENNREKLEFDLHMAFAHRADYFTARLFQLYARADNSNRAKLSIGFPEEAVVFEDWYKDRLQYHYHEECQ